ncbi:hypothetical protein LK996_12260 [Lysobacter sp. A6]|uniref:Uncharacterized protein n=1 Tax=Noviluteimonas lactosilytica TaxID=2888523 RepID=A0ABS8JJW4_9GAMM|nr:hypothetical protein [Lysobacter lactosilyticus]MCC8363847.1 hypothetical protein [Lysobacter lactosilyticus]
MSKYVERVCQIAAASRPEKEMRAEVARTVADAQDHFLKVAGSDPASTLENFIGQLRFKASLANEDANPGYADVLRLAADEAARASRLG